MVQTEYEVVMDIALLDEVGYLITSESNLETTVRRGDRRGSKQMFEFDPKKDVDVDSYAMTVERFEVLDPKTCDIVASQNVQSLETDNISHITLDGIVVSGDFDPDSWKVIEKGFTLAEFEEEL